MEESGLNSILEKEKLLAIEKSMVIKNALQGNDAPAYYQAAQYLKKIEEREVTDAKSLLVDPLTLTSSFGYKDKPFQLSYNVLRGMSRTHIVNAIIETRKEQVVR